MQEYRIEDLAREAGTTVRNVRAYRDRGLLPAPRRAGRVALYSDAHLGRLRLIAALLERGYTLANIAELLDAWEQGRDISELLGLEAALAGPWVTDEPVTTTTLAELFEIFGEDVSDEQLTEVVDLGILAVDPDDPDRYRVTNPALLNVGAELTRSGVPLSASLEHARQLRTQVEAIAHNFVDLTTTHIFDPIGDVPPVDRVSGLAEMVQRLRPLAQQAVEAELARAMERLVTATLGERVARMLDDLKTTEKSEAS